MLTGVYPTGLNPMFHPHSSAVGELCLWNGLDGSAEVAEMTAAVDWWLQRPWLQHKLKEHTKLNPGTVVLTVLTPRYPVSAQRVLATVQVHRNEPPDSAAVRFCVGYGVGFRGACNPTAAAVTENLFQALQNCTTLRYPLKAGLPKTALPVDAAMFYRNECVRVVSALVEEFKHKRWVLHDRGAGLLY